MSADLIRQRLSIARDIRDLHRQLSTISPPVIAQENARPQPAELTLKTALSNTLESALSEHFDRQTRQAWNGALHGLLISLEKHHRPLHQESEAD